MLFTNAHGQEEITAMTLDNTARRLMTGARNGTVKVMTSQKVLTDGIISEFKREILGFLAKEEEHKGL